MCAALQVFKSDQSLWGKKTSPIWVISACLKAVCISSWKLKKNGWCLNKGKYTVGSNNIQQLKKKKFSGINESSSLKVSPISKVLKFAFRGRDQNLFSREWWGTRWRWGSKITDSKESHHWWGKTRFIQSEGVCSVATSRLPEQGAHSPGAQTGVYTSPYNSVRWMR